MKFQPDIIVMYTHSVSNGGIRVHKLPKAGETVRALESGRGIDGAKGTNVAVAAGRVGAKVALVAHVQGGEWFHRAKELLREEGIDDRFVVCQPGTRRASGCIIIDDEGNNMIILGSGTQQAIPRDEIDRALESLREAKYCVTGYELELESVKYLVKKAKSLGIRTVLNPSPVPNQAPDFWGFVDVLVLNEVEVAHILRLAGCPPAEQWEKNAALLRNIYGCQQVVITLGDKGFCCLDQEGNITKGEGLQVRSIDATGAGDGFLGSMTARLAAGDSLGEACRWANRYAAFTVQKSGTISSYPTISELASNAE